MNTNLSKLQVLIVDDERNILNIYCTMLDMEGHKCICAPSAEDAIRILEDTPIDILVTDHRMPGISGEELLGYVKEKSPDTRRIMISGDAGIAQHSAELVEQGLAHKFVKKPCDVNTFLKAIKEQVNQVPIG